MPPQVFDTISALRSELAFKRINGGTIGFVPTMGALHAGHGVLMKRARLECDYVVVSIFVNPTQFDRKDDFEAYVIDLGRDMEFCHSLGVDAVFAPAPREMYPEPQSVFVEATGVSERLCGEFRPGHFRAIATVVTKLFNIVGPDVAYFGEKDAQQLAVIQKMVRQLNVPIEIRPVATVRDPDGLALSSRNKRLTPEQRKAAPLLFRALQAAQTAVAQKQSLDRIRRGALDLLESEPLIKVEYLEIVDPQTMMPVDRLEEPVRLMIAAWLGNTRLIDNLYCALA